MFYLQTQAGMKTTRHDKFLFLIKLPMHGDDHIGLIDRLKRPGFVKKMALNMKDTISIRL
jgi:hypothetical protein